MQNGFFQNLIRKIEWSLITDFDIILKLNIPYNSQSIKDHALSVNLNRKNQTNTLSVQRIARISHIFFFQLKNHSNYKN